VVVRDVEVVVETLVVVLWETDVDIVVVVMGAKVEDGAE
jgi:hypothetical protein